MLLGNNSSAWWLIDYMRIFLYCVLTELEREWIKKYNWDWNQVLLCACFTDMKSDFPPPPFYLIRTYMSLRFHNVFYLSAFMLCRLIIFILNLAFLCSNSLEELSAALPSRYILTIIYSPFHLPSFIFLQTVIFYRNWLNINKVEI